MSCGAGLSAHTCQQGAFPDRHYSAKDTSRRGMIMCHSHSCTCMPHLLQAAHKSHPSSTLAQ